MKFRHETDSMGTVRVPQKAYYGAQTQRAVDNFFISGLKLPSVFIRALARIKQCAARVNCDLNLLDKPRADVIIQAARETMEGRFSDQFVVDVFQTGSGTSTNMNMNEVLASRGNEILTGKKGGKNPIHPNDHVNLGQSSNDVIPSTLHMAALESIRKRLLPGLRQLNQSLSRKVDEFSDVTKLGRTHLQDAVPLTLGQEFSGYARQIELGIVQLGAVEERLSELALGGTAVGTGENTHPEFGPRIVFLISEQTGIAFKQAKNHFEAQACRDAAVETSGVLKTLAVSLTKIANDIRWLASGPRCGIGEINLPSLQPGSSIMPGKVNPVMAEVVLQVAAQVMGNDTAIMIGGQAGNFELNVMIPVIARNLLESIEILAAASEAFAVKCIDGISANRQKCAANINKSLALATRLVPHIGYDRAATVAQKASKTQKTIMEIIREEKILPENVIEKIMTNE